MDGGNTCNLASRVQCTVSCVARNNVWTLWHIKLQSTAIATAAAVIGEICTAVEAAASPVATTAAVIPVAAKSPAAATAVAKKQQQKEHG